MKDYIVVRSAFDKEFMQKASTDLMKDVVERDVLDESQVLGSSVVHNAPTALKLLMATWGRMEEHTGLELCPTYAYTRLYSKDMKLDRHSDRPSCEISTTLCMCYESDDLWPIFVQPNDAEGPVSVELDVGDMLIYRGCDVEHWRGRLKGKKWLQVFLHYVDKNGPHFPEYAFDKCELNPLMKTFLQIRAEQRFGQPNLQEPQVHGDILIYENVLSKEACDHVLAECDRKTFVKSTTFGSDGAASTYRTSSAVGLSRDLDLAEVNGLLANAFRKSVWAAPKHLGLYGDLDITRDEGYSVLRYEPGQYYNVHIDSDGEYQLRHLSLLLYLNDDYEGGALDFPRQGFKYQPKAGSLVMFPSNWTHPHAGEPVTSGAKYAVVTWAI